MVSTIWNKNISFRVKWLSRKEQTNTKMCSVRKRENEIKILEKIKFDALQLN